MDLLHQYFADDLLLDSARVLNCGDQIQQQDDIQQVDDATLLLPNRLLHFWPGAAHVADHRIKDVCAFVAVHP